MTKNKNKFRKVYTDELREAVRNHPKEYGWPESDVEKVAGKMFAAMDAGTFSHHGRSFYSTAKKLGIKATRTSILEYWNQPDREQTEREKLTGMTEADMAKLASHGICPQD